MNTKSLFKSLLIAGSIFIAGTTFAQEHNHDHNSHQHEEMTSEIGERKEAAKAFVQSLTEEQKAQWKQLKACLLYTSPSPRDA